MTNPQSAESIFLAALEKANPAERAAYLDEACRGDDDLRRRVERLLEAHPQVGSFLEQPLAGRLAQEARAPGTGPEAAGPPPAGEQLEATRAECPGGDASDDLAGLLAPPQKPGSLGRLGHYEVLEVVGRGGMGVVLKGFDEKLHRIVALKVMSRELAASGSARQRFTREARAAAAVSHDNVVTIHAVDADHRPPYLVMQFVAGVSLQEKLDRSGPLGLEEILRIGMQTAEGLAAAHRQGLVHRDVKPANILLENGVERVKITDFGLARAAADASLTQSGVVAGTPMYMSPEQAAGEPVDHRSDLFSLGSVLYAMCTGRPPFRAEGSHAVLRRVIEDTPRPIPEVNPTIPDWLCDVVARLHAKRPADRFQSAQEVADLLGRLLARLQRPDQAEAPAAAEKPPAIPARKRRRVWQVAAALALIALGGGLLLAYLAGWPFRPPQTQRPEQAGPKPTPDGGDGGPPPAGEKRPAPREVLEELRRAVAAEEEKLRIVQLSFMAEQVTRLEVCQTEALLIEAQIRLAAAEQKPVIPLLEQLVRDREEELSQIEARAEAGALAEVDVFPAKRRLSEARARLAAARAESTDEKP
jgi:hypothetical protein